MKSRTAKIISMLLSLMLLLPGTALADDWFESERGYYILMDDQGNELTMMARRIYVDDEYISGSNKHYVVYRVDSRGRIAYARLRGEITLPEFTAVHSDLPAAQQGPQSVILYTTHNSESYVPSDGTESIKGEGGILDVAEALRKALEEKGIHAVLDKTHHDPHDAGSYRRSRQTAVNLIRNNAPVRAKFDIHRDAVPRAAYATQVDGQDMTKVRMVIGRRNQNRQANEELAKQIKSVADRNYPGLIKDIFFGRGSYNQELSPRSLLFEMGTYGSRKEEAQKSARYLADVIQKAMFGGTFQQKDQQGRAQGPAQRVRPINEVRPNGGNRGILWVVLALVAGAVAFLFISTGGREMASKVTKFTRQEFGSFLGRKKRK